jgi:hypothetical protein
LRNTNNFDDNITNVNRTRQGIICGTNHRRIIKASRQDKSAKIQPDTLLVILNNLSGNSKTTNLVINSMHTTRKNQVV